MQKGRGRCATPFSIFFSSDNEINKENYMLKEHSQTDVGANGDQPLTLSDIQGLILRGYKYQTYIRYFIFRIGQAKDAVSKVKEFCKEILPGSNSLLTVTTAVDWGESPPPYCLNIGMTASGLKQLIGKENYYNTVYNNTSGAVINPFDTGAAASATAATVGDTGPSAPANWWQKNWQLESPPSNDGLDILVCLYAISPKDRENFALELHKMIPACKDGSPSMVAVVVQDSDPILDSEGAQTENIHFGYRDGISQPRIQGTPWDDPGHPNDDSPLVPSSHFVIAEQGAGYNADTLLVNGCFGAFRLLYQDIGAFNAFIGQGQNPDLVAAKMCGRWLNGVPLEVSPDTPNPPEPLTELDLTNFNYITPTTHQQGLKQTDTWGQNCPYASHTRRTNPRDDTSVHFNDDYAETHRVRRFAKPFGPPYIASEPIDEYRGLVGLFMGANLTDQFEFIMQTWMSAGSFRSPDAPNQSGVDPVFGPQQGEANTFQYNSSKKTTQPPKPVLSSYETISGLQRFIRTDGGLYVFLPGLTALNDIAQCSTLPPPTAGNI
jgi:deferrochelatase/peroxidase EfeB